MGAMVKRLSQRSVAARSRVRFPLAPQINDEVPLLGTLLFVRLKRINLFTRVGNRKAERYFVSRQNRELGSKKSRSDEGLSVTDSR